MTTTALSIPDSNWNMWVEAVADTRYIRHLEVPAELVLSGDAALSETAAQSGLRVSFVRDLVAPEAARNATELADAPRHELIGNLCSRIKCAGDYGVSLGTLDVGVGNIPAENPEKELARRVQFLRRLMPAAAEAEVTIALPARYPPAYPGARQWENVGNIIHEVMHPECKFAVDVFPAELPPDFDIPQFLRQCGYQMGVVRFNYEPLLGEGFEPGQDELWARALQRHAFRGGVVFRPRNVESEEAVKRVCTTADRWANTFWNVFK